MRFAVASLGAFPAGIPAYSDSYSVKRLDDAIFLELEICLDHLLGVPVGIDDLEEIVPLLRRDLDSDYRKGGQVENVGRIALDLGVNRFDENVLTGKEEKRGHCDCEFFHRKASIVLLNKTRIPAKAGIPNNIVMNVVLYKFVTTKELYPPHPSST